MCAIMHLYNGSNRDAGTGQTLVSESGSESLAGGHRIVVPAKKSLHPKGLPALSNPAKGTPAMHYMAARGIAGFPYTCQTTWSRIWKRAIRNGRDLQKLMTEAGRRYTLALKNERNLRNRK